MDLITDMESIPLSTYRLQFNSQFTFKQAKELTEYFHNLGISHCYSSPIFTAKPGSIHGYDVVDHKSLNPEIGTEEEFKALIKDLHHREMGLILDIVPNHMLVMDSNNKWWMDILENGQTSPYAEYFDIDWHPPRKELRNKVLLPLLDQEYGDALENQVLQIIYHDGSYYLQLPNLLLPTDPKTWNLILEPMVKEAEKILNSTDAELIELQSIVTSLHHLPTTVHLEREKIKERLREKEVIKKRLGSLISNTKTLANLMGQQLTVFNGKKGDPASFNKLETFLDLQPYRLCYWRVANDEINYRRFFDISELAGIKTENPKVFEAIHELAFKFLDKQYIDGLRIDHIDGLWDPEKYSKNLQKLCHEHLPDLTKDELFYVIAEKILTGNEKLRKEWSLYGTVGYDFLNQVNGLYVNQQHKKAFFDIYRNFTGIQTSVFELIYSSKKLILLVSMSSELHVLARHLDLISEQHRISRDFTQESLRVALRDVIACFPVYRSYIQAEEGIIHDEDRQYIVSAISRAKRLNPAINASIFDFIQSVLLLEYPQGINELEVAERQNFVMRFQQLTSPVMAKGLEDTAFYRFYPLASLNEVGADISTFGTTIEQFHKKNLERFELWPHTLNASSTHDTKRSEDARARINVLSEIPMEWEQALLRWSKMNEKHKKIDGEETTPDSNEEYLFYQTLIGSWPLLPSNSINYQKYVERIQGYMEKAIKEAKINSSWINPNKYWDQGVQQFVKNVLSLENENPFLNDFKDFIEPILEAGMLNSLSQLILKMMSPGVPDIYQGNEIWDFSLVDPDNRHSIDYDIRQSLFKSIIPFLEKPNIDHLQQLIQNPKDGRIKLYITSLLLKLRQSMPEVFSDGEYIPLEVEGERKNQVIAFARAHQNQVIIVIVTRFFFALGKNSYWKNTLVKLPKNKNSGRNILTNEKIDTSKGEINLENTLTPIPFAILETK